MPQKIKPARSNKTCASKIPAEVIPGSGLKVAMLERLFESLGCKLVTVKVVKPIGNRKS